MFTYHWKCFLITSWPRWQGDILWFPTNPNSQVHPWHDAMHDAMPRSMVKGSKFVQTAVSFRDPSEAKSGYINGILPS